MQLSDIKMMYEEISLIQSMLKEYQGNLEYREWANFYDVFNPQVRRFEWILETLDKELREWD